MSTATTARRIRAMSATGIDRESRTVELSFSSENDCVKRWSSELGCEAPEVLDHSRDAADLSRLLTVGSVLLNHDPDQIVAVPTSAQIDPAAGRGRAIIRFGKTPQAREAFQAVIDGILRGVVLGYEITAEEHVRAGETSSNGKFTGPCIVGTQWRALEISLTPIPADASVGINRSRTLGPANLVEPLGRQIIRTDAYATFQKRRRSAEIEEAHTIMGRAQVPVSRGRQLMAMGLSLSQIFKASRRFGTHDPFKGVQPQELFFEAIIADENLFQQGDAFLCNGRSVYAGALLTGDKVLLSHDAHPLSMVGCVHRLFFLPSRRQYRAIFRFIESGPAKDTAAQVLAGELVGLSPSFLSVRKTELKRAWRHWERGTIIHRTVGINEISLTDSPSSHSLGIVRVRKELPQTLPGAVEITKHTDVKKLFEKLKKLHKDIGDELPDDDAVGGTLADSVDEPITTESWPPIDNA